MVRAGVPETSIHEYRYSDGHESNVRSALQERKIQSEAKTASMQLTMDRHFQSGRRPPHFLHLGGDSLIQRRRPFSADMTSQIIVPFS
jgi:hypothetical protein